MQQLQDELDVTRTLAAKAQKFEAEIIKYKSALDQTKAQVAKMTKTTKEHEILTAESADMVCWNI